MENTKSLIVTSFNIVDNPTIGKATADSDKTNGWIDLTVETPAGNSHNLRVPIAAFATSGHVIEPNLANIAKGMGCKTVPMALVVLMVGGTINPANVEWVDAGTECPGDLKAILPSTNIVHNGEDGGWLDGDVRTDFKRSGLRLKAHQLDSQGEYGTIRFDLSIAIDRELHAFDLTFPVTRGGQTRDLPIHVAARYTDEATKAVASFFDAVKYQNSRWAPAPVIVNDTAETNDDAITYGEFFADLNQLVEDTKKVPAASRTAQQKQLLAAAKVDPKTAMDDATYDLLNDLVTALQQPAS